MNCPAEYPKNSPAPGASLPQAVSGDGSRILVYFADTAALADNSTFLDLYSSASEYRRKKTDQYCFRRDKSLSLCAEGLLMRGCRDFGVDYRRQTVSLGQYGKPFFCNSSLCFNLSHSGEKAMCIMSRYQVGCDVERMAEWDMDIAKYFCSREELACLQACAGAEEKRVLFYRLWTLKESFIKCTGQGMSFPMDSLSLLSGGKVTPCYSHEGSLYWLFGGELGSSYQYGFCIKTDGAAAEHPESIRENYKITFVN